LIGRVPVSSGTLPPGFQMYWKSGCSVQPGTICAV
jgi:hypothetical protein